MTEQTHSTGERINHMMINRSHVISSTVVTSHPKQRQPTCRAACKPASLATRHNSMDGIGEDRNAGFVQSRHVDAAAVEHVDVEFLHHALRLRL